ncbi:hypothetical protein DYB32_005458 [Aphanomyces invadans]|nr:hypothetical protein DYB32_005458 [Aphanomyces invadans]
MQARRPPLCVEHVRDQRLELDADETAFGVHLRGVERCDIVCTACRVAQISIEDCADVRVSFVSVVASVEVMRCRGVHLTYAGSCGTITIDGSSHIAMNIPAATVDAVWVVATRVSHLCLRLQKDDDDGILPTTASTSKAGSDSIDASDKPVNARDLVLDVVDNSTITWQNGAFVASPLERHALFTTL